MRSAPPATTRPTYPDEAGNVPEGCAELGGHGSGKAFHNSSRRRRSASTETTGRAHVHPAALRAVLEQPSACHERELLLGAALHLGGLSRPTLRAWQTLRA